MRRWEPHKLEISCILQTLVSGKFGIVVMALEIGGNLFFVERGWLSANPFVFTGAEKILIDTGYVRDFSETERCIREGELSGKGV